MNKGEIIDRFRRIGVTLTRQQSETLVLMQGIKLTSAFADSWWHNDEYGVFAEVGPGGMWVFGYAEEDSAGGVIAPDGSLRFDVSFDSNYLWHHSAYGLLEQEACLSRVLGMPRPLDIRCICENTSVAETAELLGVHHDPNATDVNMLFPETDAVTMILRYEGMCYRDNSALVVLSRNSRTAEKIVERLARAIRLINCPREFCDTSRKVINRLSNAVVEAMDNVRPKPLPN